MADLPTSRGQHPPQDKQCPQVHSNPQGPSQPQELQSSPGFLHPQVQTSSPAMQYSSQSSPLTPPPMSPLTPQRSDLADDVPVPARTGTAIMASNEATPDIDEPSTKRVCLQAPTVTGPSTRTRSKARDAEEQGQTVVNPQPIHLMTTGSDITLSQNMDNGTAAREGSSEVSAGERNIPLTKNACKRKRDASSPIDIHAGKPEPSGAPQAWAYTRSALCNALPWYFGAHEGSASTTDKVLRGMLVDGGMRPNDKFTSQVIITSVGGGKAMNAAGKMVREKNQKENSKEVQGTLTVYKENRTVGLITGSRNPLLSVVPPCEYNVMDLFVITDVWKETAVNSEGKRVGYYVARYEKFDLTTPSWWSTNEQQEQENFAPGEYKCDKKTCAACGTESKHIYKHGWTCLNWDCTKFSQFNHEVDLENLVYNTNFMRERASREGYRMSEKLIPDLPTASMPNGEQSYGVEDKFRQGIVCPKCGCCSRRILWEKWVCENPKCDFTYTVALREYPITEVLKEGEKKIRTKYDKDLLQYQGHEIAGYKVDTYLCPREDGEIIGAISVYRATPEICAMPGGPDDLYKMLQKEDLPLKRGKGLKAGARSEELCSHFNFNTGAPYKFGVHVDTIGLDESPEVTLRGLGQLTWAQSQTLPVLSSILEEKQLPFSKESMSLKQQSPNEILTLGYFEKSLINYHDDGEKELGPTVSSLSLGSPAVMRFKPKLKNTLGKKLNSIRGSKEVALAFPLRHGDMVIMHGTDIHKYYVHMVQPAGKLRFALTSRYIRPETIADPEARREALEKGKVPEGIEERAYKGIGSNVASQIVAVEPESSSSDAGNGSTNTDTMDDIARSGETMDNHSANTQSPPTSPPNAADADEGDWRVHLSPGDEFLSMCSGVEDFAATNPVVFDDLSPAAKTIAMRILLKLTEKVNNSRMSPPGET